MSKKCRKLVKSHEQMLNLTKIHKECRKMFKHHEIMIKKQVKREQKTWTIIKNWVHIDKNG